MTTDLFGTGLTGKSLTDFERRILRESPPYAIVLFGRNIKDAQQLRDLIAEIRAIAARPPLMMIDMEGGRVDRLRNLVPGMPSAEAVGLGERPEEMAGALGRIIGKSLRYFDIDVNLAPVVDIRGTAEAKGLERRMFGADPETVTRLAGAFVRGLQAMGVAACLKHFPGIGRGTADPHYAATVIDVPLAELNVCELVPYRRLGYEAAAVMIGHGSYPQIESPAAPATLSSRVATQLLRETVGFTGVAITDDMEMHAVSDLDSFEGISEKALMAGNDVILYCSQIERLADLQQFFRKRAGEDSRFAARAAEASRRAESYRAHAERLRAEAPPPVGTFEELLAEAHAFCDVFAQTRPESRETETPAAGTGRTGREEWT
ncbi:MAG TPA: glycoside hydrolase family 3 N-terminal domain-containing protein [Thermoanaerobaculia bacterium]|nr:glycoside hydrolase family 3 N-terminal domain-containing protein [Thermoanaerobaculia bacterium]